MLLQRFNEHLTKSFPFLKLSQKLLLAVSGGIDSVVMADLFYKSDFNFVIAHCNFQLREEESERDEAFVCSLALKFDKEVLVKRFETKEYAAQKKISIQEAARKLRYDWFGELQTTNYKLQTINYIVTAHNSDDNVETALMFFLRGTGINGLTGIPEYDEERKIIRPLLFAGRNEINEYAKEKNLNWVEDSSNASDKYTRNFLRNHLIPSFKNFFPEVKKNITENIKRFKEVEELYNYAIQNYKKKLLEYKDNEIHIPVLKLQKIKPLNTVLWEIIKEYNFHSNQIEEIKKLFTADNSSYVLSGTHRIIKNRNWLIIASNKTEEADLILIEEGEQQVSFKNGFLKLELLSTLNNQLQTTNLIAQLDAKLLQFPLLLRKWIQGDYFYPLGMQKKKKLSRFFIDRKLSSIQKENIWVLESNKKIIWVIGYRIDNRFKVTNSTGQILKITLHKK